ncbi:MAG TPA: hypothetical protein VJT75_18380 [Thermoleophilaceae bacterium]|nr:hypothetical protein [Thermoleophilaceae bacterium]
MSPRRDSDPEPPSATARASWSQDARWWLLLGAFAGTVAASAVWAVAERADRAELATIVMYSVLPALVPLAAARLPGRAFAAVTLPLLVVESFLLLLGVVPLALAIPPQLLALRTSRPAPPAAIRRWLVAVLALGAATLVGMAIAIPQPARLVACVDPTLPDDRAIDAGNAVFDLTSDRDVTGAARLDEGVELDLEAWASDGAIARLERRARAIEGIARVRRGSADGC